MQEKDIGDGWTETFTPDKQEDLVDIDHEEKKTVQVVGDEDIDLDDLDK